MSTGRTGWPDWSTLWRFGADTRVTFFGAGAAFFANCMKAELDLAQCGDLTNVRALGTTGSPLSADVQNWVNAQFEKTGTSGIWWANISGGTDFAGAFIGGWLLGMLGLFPGGGIVGSIIGATVGAVVLLLLLRLVRRAT